MRHHRLDFIRAETLQHAIGYGYQGSILVPAGGKGVSRPRWEDSHFRHADIGLTRQLCDGINQPLLLAIGWRFNHPYAGTAFGHPLGHQQGNECTGEADDCAKDQQRL